MKKFFQIGRAVLSVQGWGRQAGMTTLALFPGIVFFPIKKGVRIRIRIRVRVSINFFSIQNCFPRNFFFPTEFFI